MGAVPDGREPIYPESLHAALIAPCGMDCGLCLGFLRTKKPCGGCNGDEALKPKSCVACSIRNCPEIHANDGDFCFQCPRFPCTRLKRLDKRYRTKYGMSMIENLDRIRACGLEAFVGSEKQRWMCGRCGGVICVHSEMCLFCGSPKILVGPEARG